MGLSAWPGFREGDVATGNLDQDTVWLGRTRSGTHYTIGVRPGTSDWNTANAAGWPQDEYQLPAGLTGWALDVGAHIGAVAVPLLLDSPDLRLVAIEALPENVAQLMANLERNGVADRCQVVHAAASDSAQPVRIGYGDVVDASGQHLYIGNASAPQGAREVWLPGATLRGLELLRGSDQDAPWAWAKIDCEGCEYAIFAEGADLSRLEFITGEVHQGWARLVDLLEPTHMVVGPGKDFGPFQAIVRVMP